MKIILLVCVSLGLLWSSSLQKQGNYVRDKDHSLLWQDDKANILNRVSQENANKYCEKLSKGGYQNWRLPNKEEYLHIIDNTREVSPMIDKAFKYAMPVAYWTSSRTWIRNFGRYGYYVLLDSGSIYYENRTYKKFVRCVRDLK